MVPAKKACSVPVVGASLILLTLVCYCSIGTHGFVGFDDPKYLLLNEHVKGGLTWGGIVWAFTTGYASNWHPLTWISHMLDCQLYGLNAGGHHFTSLLLHTANVLLLFVLLRNLTGAFWRSAIVAGFFAWHPLHVESVAWAAERKDVLSTFFFLLTLLAYGRGAREAECELQGSGFSPARQLSLVTRHWLALLFFALGLMSKPMLVTVPFVLLLLDFWPLKRLAITLPLPSGEGRGEGDLGCASRKKSDFEIPLTLTLSRRERETRGNAQRKLGVPFACRLLIEKIPFFVLSLVASVITYYVQKAGGAVSSFTAVPFSARLENALVAYARYLGKTIWPAGLSVFYPLPDHWSALAVAGSAVLLVGVTVACLLSARRLPFLAVGWFWFVGTLVPVIGLVQVGSQSMADRYMYIPSIGLFVMVVWGVGELVRKSAEVPLGAGVTEKGCVTEIPLTPALSRGERENRCQSVGESCVLEIPARQPLLLPLPSGEGRGEGNSGGALATVKDAEAPVGQREIEKRGGLLSARFAGAVAAIALGACLACTSVQVGYWRSEETLFAHAMQVAPDNYLAYDHLAKVCESEGRTDDALTFYKALLRLKPRYPEGQYNMGTLLMGMGKVDEAVPHLREALWLRPNWAQAHSNLGICLFKQNKLDEALPQLRAAAELDPQDPDVFVNLGVSCLTINRPAEAAKALARAAELKPSAPEIQFLLALALSHENKTAEAALRASRARELALSTGQQELVTKADELLTACRPERALTRTP